MLALLTCLSLLLASALAQDAYFPTTSRSTSICAAAKVGGIDLTILPFATAALESIENAYIPIVLPPFSNASRSDVHGESSRD